MIPHSQLAGGRGPRRPDDTMIAAECPHTRIIWPFSWQAPLGDGNDRRSAQMAPQRPFPAVAARPTTCRRLLVSAEGLRRPSRHRRNGPGSAPIRIRITAKIPHDTATPANWTVTYRASERRAMQSTTFPKQTDASRVRPAGLPAEAEHHVILTASDPRRSARSEGWRQRASRACVMPPDSRGTRRLLGQRKREARGTGRRCR